MELAGLVGSNSAGLKEILLSVNLFGEVFLKVKRMPKNLNRSILSKLLVKKNKNIKTLEDIEKQ